MEKLRIIIEKTNTPAGKWFDVFIQLLIISSLILFSLGTIPNVQAEYGRLLRHTEVIIVSIFSFEYFLRIFVAKRKTSYLLSFYGIVDLLAILPFYLSIGVDLRALRIFRILRVFSILKLVRYNRALNRFKIAFGIIKEELFLFLFVTAIFVFLASSGIYYFERDAQPEVFNSIFHSFWWAIVTLSTVGYGDVYPITTGGRIFTSFVIFAGVGVVAVPAGLLSSAFSKARQIEAELKEKENI